MPLSEKTAIANLNEDKVPYPSMPLISVFAVGLSKIMEWARMSCTGYGRCYRYLSDAGCEIVRAGLDLTCPKEVGGDVTSLTHGFRIESDRLQAGSR